MSQWGTGEKHVSACSVEVHRGNPAAIIAEIVRMKQPGATVVYMGSIQYGALREHLILHYQIRRVETLKKFDGLLVRLLPMDGLLVV